MLSPYLVNLNDVDIGTWLSQPSNVYIGRRCRKISKYSNLIKTFRFRNPYKMAEGDRYAALINYIDNIDLDEKYIYELRHLSNKNLGCWCVPDLCHGHVLICLVNLINATYVFPK